MTHTPRPWHVSKSLCWSIQDSHDHTVAVAYGNHLQGLGMRRTELEANAHLIAAAPDLLDAAEQLLTHVCFGDHGQIRDQAYLCIAVADPKVQTLQLAINKAKEAE